MASPTRPPLERSAWQALQRESGFLGTFTHLFPCPMGSLQLVLISSAEVGGLAPLQAALQRLDLPFLEQGGLHPCPCLNLARSAARRNNPTPPHPPSDQFEEQDEAHHLRIEC